MLFSLLARMVPLQLTAALLGAPGDGAQPVQTGLAFQLPAVNVLSQELASSALAQAPAQNPPAGQPQPPVFAPFSRAGRIATRGGIGFTLDPTAFLLGLEGDYSLTNDLAAGLLMQVAFSDHKFIFAPTLHGQWMFDLPIANLERLKPFFQGGVGLAYIQRDRPGPNEDDFGFLLNVGAGAEYYLSDRFSIGNNILFNVMPDKVLDEHFFFSWQFITARYVF
jgi:hypothetical protein